MSQVFHGVVVRCSEPEARALFASLVPRLPLRLVRLDDEVFGIYASRDYAKAPRELQRIAAQLSHTTGAALFYWYDTRVGDWYQLFEHGLMTRELDPCSRSHDSWGKGDPLEAIGASRSLHNIVEEAFLYNILEPLAENRPEWWKFKR
jgi:hypothetical protein